MEALGWDFLRPVRSAMIGSEWERKVSLNQKDAQGLMARNCRGNGPGSRLCDEVSIERFLTQAAQRLAVAVEVRLFWIDFIVIGREYGILRGTNGLMDRIISAAPAYTGMNAVVFAAVSMVQMGAVKRPLYAAHPR